MKKLDLDIWDWLELSYNNIDVVKGLSLAGEISSEEIMPRMYAGYDYSEDSEKILRLHFCAKYKNTVKSKGTAGDVEVCLGKETGCARCKHVTYLPEIPFEEYMTIKRMFDISRSSSGKETHKGKEPTEVKKS